MRRRVTTTAAIQSATTRPDTTCCCWIGNEEAGNIAGVLGAHDGSLYRTDGGRKLADALPLHNGPVTALVAFEPKAEEGPCVISAGMDGKIKLLGAELDVKYEFDMRKRDYGAYKWGVSSACLTRALVGPDLDFSAERP